MKNKIVNFVMASFTLLIIGLSGCGGGGGDSVNAPTETPGLITALSGYFANNSQDYSSATCDLRVFVYYNPTLSVDDIDTFTLTSPNGLRWTANTSKQFGTNSSGMPYISGQFYDGHNPAAFPLAGIWTAQLNLKNGQFSTYQRTFHEPGSTADATHPYVYAPEDYTPTDASQYIAALRRFPTQGYTLSYSAANGGKIVSTGLAPVRSQFLAAEPRAYNLYCWLYDANINYLGYTTFEYSTSDHTSLDLIDDGELSIIPWATISSTGIVDLSRVKFIRFLNLDGAQYVPISYGGFDYLSISALVPVN